jgi:hypothetical protein
VVFRLGALLDACVLYPAALRDTLLRAAAAGLYRAFWSDEILDEVHRNLVANGRATGQQATRLIGIMASFFPDARVADYEHLVLSVTAHPKDRHVVAAAAVGGAGIIVTSNLRDFPTTALEPFNLRAVSPDEFLSELFDASPDDVTAIILEQAADLKRPPMRPADVLDALAASVPHFAALVRAHLETRS